MGKVLTDIAVLGLFLSGVLVFIVGVKKAIRGQRIDRLWEEKFKFYENLDKK